MTTLSALVSALRNVPIRKLVSALEQDGFTLQRSKGSHRVYTDGKGRLVIIAVHRGGATLPRDTLRNFLQATRWNRNDAIRLELLASQLRFLLDTGYIIPTHPPHPYAGMGTEPRAGYASWYSSARRGRSAARMYAQSMLSAVLLSILTSSTIC